MVTAGKVATLVPADQVPILMVCAARKSFSRATFVNCIIQTFESLANVEFRVIVQRWKPRFGQLLDLLTGPTFSYGLLVAGRGRMRIL